MKKNNKRKKNILLILILVVVISIGYAALASNLKINGSSKISKATWNIHWENPVVTTGSVTMDEPSITGEDRQTAEFSVTLNEPGDFYEFTIDAVNTGTIPAVLDSIESKVNGELIGENTLPNRVNYKVTYGDGTEIDLENDVLKLVLTGNVRQVFKVRVEYSEDIEASDLDETNDLELNFQFKANYVQAPKTQSVEPKEAGSRVCFGTECFYVVSSNSEKTVLLAETILNVGEQRNTSITEGIQSDPYEDGMFKYPITFSTKTYWLEDDKCEYIDSTDSWNCNLKSKYNSQQLTLNPNNDWRFHYLDGTIAAPNVYDNTYVGEPGTSNYSVAYYIERYVALLKTAPYGAPNDITGRLLTVEEVGCGNDAIRSCENMPDWIQYCSSDLTQEKICEYFLGSLATPIQYLAIYGDKSISYGDTTWYDVDALVSLRPVIEIPTSEIN